MKYHSRIVEKRLNTLRRLFPVVVIVGARQTGKTTLLRHFLGDSIPHFVFDPLDDLYGARQDPDFFLDEHPAPLFLDEIQYAPELLPALKRRVDRAPGKGQYFLSGSQNLAVLKDVAESMSGRAGILELPPFAVSEWVDTAKEESWLSLWLSGQQDMLRSRPLGRNSGNCSMAQTLWRGMMPGLLDVKEPELVSEFHNSYVMTYLDRDVRRAGEIRNLTDFRRMLGLLGALTAREINHTQLGRELGIARATVREWLSIVEATYQWRVLAPYHGNAVKRLSAHGKGHLADTGLACFLQRISSPDALLVSPLLGNIFESFVVNNLVKLATGLSSAPLFYHWRSHAGAEVDIVLEIDGKLWPFECKAGSKVSVSDLSGIRAFRETYASAAKTPAAVIAAVTEVRKITEDCWAIPYDLA